MCRSPEGNWTLLPEGFAQFCSDEACYWEYSEVDIPGTGLIAGVGPWRMSLAGEQDYCYYSIDIEVPEGERRWFVWFVWRLAFAARHFQFPIISPLAAEIFLRG